MIFAAMFASLGLVEAQGGTATALAVVAGVALGSAGWWVLFATVVDRMRGRLQGPVFVWVNRVSGAALAGFGLWAFFGRVGPSGLSSDRHGTRIQAQRTDEATQDLRILAPFRHGDEVGVADVAAGDPGQGAGAEPGRHPIGIEVEQGPEHCPVGLGLALNVAAALGLHEGARLRIRGQHLAHLLELGRARRRRGGLCGLGAAGHEPEQQSGADRPASVPCPAASAVARRRLDQPVLDHRLGDLDRVQRRTLAQIVRDHPQVQPVADGRVLADARDEHAILADALGRA